MAFPPSGYPAVDGVTPVVAADFNDVVAALQAHIGATVSFHGVSHVVTESNLEGLAQAIVGTVVFAKPDEQERFLLACVRASR